MLFLLSVSCVHVCQKKKKSKYEIISIIAENHILGLGLLVFIITFSYMGTTTLVEGRKPKPGPGFAT